MVGSSVVRFAEFPEEFWRKLERTRMTIMARIMKSRKMMGIIDPLNQLVEFVGSAGVGSGTGGSSLVLSKTVVSWILSTFDSSGMGGGCG